MLALPGVTDTVLNCAVPILALAAVLTYACEPGLARLKISLPRSLVDNWRDWSTCIVRSPVAPL
ncbi:hypothetical protein D3C72_779660 [compost metagenome]